MKKILCVALLGISAAAGAAQPLDVVINEVAWMGTEANTADEWIELHNNTSQDVDLAGWYILDDNGAQTYALSGVVPAGGYFLVEDREQATSATAGIIIDLSLANTGDRLELFDATDNSIDLLDCSAAWYAGDNAAKSSMERRDPTLPGSWVSNWGDNDGVTANGTDANANALLATPGAQNSVFGPLPGPEIANIHCLDLGAIDVYFNAPVEQASAERLSNYVVSLSTGDVLPLLATLDTNDASLVHLQGLPINTTERAQITVLGVADAMTGAESDTDTWFMTGVIPVELARLDLDGNRIPDLCEVAEGTFFTVHGIITTVGSFDYRESYLQDSAGGLAIFETAAASFWVGDEARVSGDLSHYRGKDQMISVRFEILSAGNPVAPLVLTLAQLSASPERYESMLIGVSSVARTGGDAWPAADNDANVQASDDGGTTTYTLRIDRNTDIDGSPEPSWPITLLGIAGQYTYDVPPLDGYQLLPRSLADLGLLNWPDGSSRPCYSGPAGTAGVGVCREGRESYSIEGGWSGFCHGEVTPEPSDDDCDGQDNDCDGVADDEVDLTSPQNCGSCGYDCTTLAHTTDQGCDTSANPPVCTFQCESGFGDCTAAAGCETQLGTTDNCTACSDSCHFPNADNSTCAAGGCQLVCNAGFGDCSGGTADGCETTLGTDENCQACGDNCLERWDNASGVCDAQTGSCEFAACDAGFGDCNQDLADGCEVSLSTDQHCGDCAVQCTGSTVCVFQADAWICSDTCHDVDNDGHADAACGGSDCDDGDVEVHPGAAERCNGRDDNCVGGIDESWPALGDACDGPDEDLCANGTVSCNAAGDGSECRGDQAVTESCNGLDDDCDGDIDEDWPALGEACDGPDEDLCANGVLACKVAGDGVVCQGDQESIEICNGEDDDCDGDIDEDLGTYTCGVGVCLTTVLNCANGLPQQCVPDTSGEHYEADVELSCTDGLDNDCDGYSDEEDLTDCKVGGSSCSCGSTANASTGLPPLLAALILLIRRRRRK